MSGCDARENARRAVEEEDRERLLAERRFTAAHDLATTPEVWEALVLGQEVPRARLRAEVLAAVGESTVGPDLSLGDDLALRVQNRIREAELEEDGAFTVRAADVRRERVEWLWLGRVPIGHVTAVVGPPGVAKSLLTCDLAARTSRGDLGAAGDVVMASAEDSLAATVRPRLEAAGADLARVRFLRFRRDGVVGDVSLPHDNDELREVVAAVLPRLVVVDPLAAHLAGSVDGHRDQAVRLAMAPLHHLADEFACAVVVVLHTNKAPGSDPLLRTGGSIGLTAVVRSALLLARDPEDPEGERGPGRVLAHFKSNLAPEAPSLRLRIEEIVVPATGNEPDVVTARIRELGVCDLTASDLLRGKKESAGPRDDARDFLLRTLSEEWTEVADAVTLAEDEGLSDRTLRRAAEELGVERRQTAVGKPWLWRLPVWPRPDSEGGQTERGQTDEAASGHGAGQTEEAASEAASRVAEAPSGHTTGQTDDGLRLATHEDGGQTEDAGVWECPRCTRLWSPPPDQCKCGHSPRLAALVAEGREEERA